MNKLIRSIGILIIIGIFSATSYAHEPVTHQLTFSFTISGHLFVGLGYSFYFDEHNALMASFQVVPAKELAFALNAGYNYYFLDKHWQPNLGAEFMMIVGPPDPDRRGKLILINLVPGIRYDFNEIHSLNGRLWVSYMPEKKPFRAFPTGLEFKYGYNFTGNGPD